MHNHSYNNRQHEFLIQGGDRRGTNRLLIVAIGLLPVVLAGWFWYTQYISMFVMGYVACLVACFVWMSSGRMERYLVGVDLDKGSIYAQDRVQKEQMWVDDFDPSWVRIAEIQVVIRGEVYRHPALVYSKEPIELVMDGVPSATRIMLGVGEREELAQVQALLGE